LLIPYGFEIAQTQAFPIRRCQCVYVQQGLFISPSRRDCETGGTNAESYFAFGIGTTP